MRVLEYLDSNDSVLYTSDLNINRPLVVIITQGNSTLFQKTVKNEFDKTTLRYLLSAKGLISKTIVCVSCFTDIKETCDYLNIEVE